MYRGVEFDGLSASDRAIMANNAKVRQERKEREEAVIQQAGGRYEEEIAELKRMIKQLEIEQARAIKSAWRKEFGDLDGFPTVYRMVLGQVIR